MCFLSLFFLPEASDFGPQELIIAWPPAKAKWKPLSWLYWRCPYPSIRFKVIWCGAFVLLFASGEVRESALESLG